MRLMQRQGAKSKMKLIELIPALELGNKLNVDVMDFPDLPEDSAAVTADTRRRKRCGITLEYAPRDIRQLREEGMDMETMLAYYRQRVYDLVKVNISQDWECIGGMDEVLGIVERHLTAAQ